MSLLGRTYEQLERLGKGGYGQVFRVRHGDEVLAAKIFDEDEWVPVGEASEETTASDLALRELAFMTLLTRCGAPHMVPVVDFDFRLGDVDALTLFMPLYAQDLATAIEEVSLSHKARAQVAVDLLSGLSFLHGSEPALVHRDIKPENVLLDAAGRAFLADFGFMTFAPGDAAETATSPHSTASTASNTDSGLLGTETYVAPEYLAGGAASPSGDMWAAGVVLLELLENRRLSASDDDEAIRYVRKRHKKLSARKRLVERVLAGMLAEAPARRTTASAALSDLRASGLWIIPEVGRFVQGRIDETITAEMQDLCVRIGARSRTTVVAACEYARRSDLDRRLLAMVAAKIHEHRSLSDEDMLEVFGLDLDALEDAQEAFVRQMRGDLLVASFAG